MQRLSKTLNQTLSAMLLMLASSLAMAELEPARIQAYIESLDEVRVLGKQLKAEGKEAFLTGQIMPREGQSFDPHQRAVLALKRDEPAYYSKLESSVVKNGFTSPESWAQTGDQVVLAYGAVKVAAESPQILAMAAQSGPDQEMLLMALPEKQRAQLKQALLIAKALAAVPEADRAAVKPYIGTLDTVFTEEGLQ